MFTRLFNSFFQITHSELKKYFLSIDAEIISISASDSDCRGSVRLSNFETAFDTLCNQPDNISFTHRWYTDWSKHRPDELKVEQSFIDSMLDSLNDDCVSEVLKFLSPLQLLYISKRNVRISNVITSKMASSVTRVKITEQFVGIIGIMNFQYLLLEYGTKIYDLVVSIKVFPSTFGLYTWDIKYTILSVIMKLAQNLKKLQLIGFDLHSDRGGTMLDIEDCAKFKNLIDFMKAKGIEVVCHDIVNEHKPFVGSFLLPDFF